MMLVLPSWSGAPDKTHLELCTMCCRRPDIESLSQTFQRKPRFISFSISDKKSGTRFDCRDLLVSLSFHLAMEYEEVASAVYAIKANQRAWSSHGNSEARSVAAHRARKLLWGLA